MPNEPIRIVTNPQDEAWFAIVDWFADNPGTLLIMVLCVAVASFGALAWQSRNKHRL